MGKAEEKSLKEYPQNIVTDYNGSHDLNYYKRVLYQQGYHQAEKDIIDNLWHDPDEEPEIDRKIIWESENFLGKHLDKEWKPKIDCFGRKERWCYLADILPSRNWTGERPYSKVDYSRGYEQAEKDNELTWEDIKTIDKLLNQCVDYSNPYQEVLKRFKERKK